MACPETASGPGDLKGSFMGGDEDIEVSGIGSREFTCNYVGAKVSECMVFKSASHSIPLSLFQTH